VAAKDNSSQIIQLKPQVLLEAYTETLE